MSRSEFTGKTKDAAFKRSNGLCEWHLFNAETMICCGAKLGPGNTFYEHINPDHNSHDNSLENCAVLCKSHWKFKTDCYDKPLIAKTKRQARRHHGIRKPSRFAGSRNSPWKKKISGEVVRR